MHSPQPALTMTVFFVQVAAEQQALAQEKQGMSRRLKEAEARADAVADTVAELRAELERQRAAADSRWHVVLIFAHAHLAAPASRLV